MNAYRSVARRSVVAGALALLAAAGSTIGVPIEQPQAQELARRPQGFIGGTVESGQGREAGVWVIAETSDLPTKFAKIVVTGDDGGFVLPELPNATYNVWVRGYGLSDSKPVTAKPGRPLALKVSRAATPAEAAKIYPANYWYSMLNLPPASFFPGKGNDVNGMPETFRNQSEFVDQLKQGCELCHQLGNQLTRSLGHMKSLGFASSLDAWRYRTQTGQRGWEMEALVRRLGSRSLPMFADWTDRIAAGELPPEPPRPAGIEQDVVITMWDWGTDTSYIHDEIATSKQNPHVNPNGRVWGVDSARGKWIVLDPNENSATEIPIPTRDDPKAMSSRFPKTMPKPSNFWGEQVVHAGVADPHNPMMDNRGRLWATSQISVAMPDWCKNGALNKYAAYFPAATPSTRQASVYDPKTGRFDLIYTCFYTHHLQFNEKQDMLYFSLGNQTIHWLNVAQWDQTKDEKTATGWCPTVLDTNGDGKITRPWNEPVGGGRPLAEGGGGGRLGEFNPTLDTRIHVGGYGIIVSPTDGSVWTPGTQYPGRVVRLELGDNPPQSCRAEMYQIPDDKAPSNFGPRGIDVDRDGVIWAALSGSGGFASFDRRKCKVLSGPSVVDGKHCPEGWTFYPLTKGPAMKSDPQINADFHYFNWVDQFNTAGFGENIPIANGSGSDSLLVLNPRTKEWTVLRVPYPMGFFSRGLDGRIDDPAAGWKGRALWANYGSNFVWHIEGGKGVKGKLVKFQIRPNPLAR